MKAVAQVLKGHLDSLLLASLENGPRHGYAVKTSDAVKLSSCCGEFLCGLGEGDVLVVVLPGGQAAVQAAEEPSEEVALGGGVPVAAVAAAVVVGAGAG